jgi:hypothetical protein
MTATDRQARLAAEQRLIREATDRLIASKAQRSDGSLTVATLAAEAGLSRQRIYEHHADLVAEFKTKTLTGGPITPNVQALRQQLADARERIHQLEANDAQLRARSRHSARLSPSSLTKPRPTTSSLCP